MSGLRSSIFLTAMAVPSKSIVWRFFTISSQDESKVDCKLCDKSVSRGGKSVKSFTTTNLMRHLENYHQTEFEEEKKKIAEEEEAKKSKAIGVGKYFPASKRPRQEKAASSGGDGKTQLSMEEALTRTKIWDINNNDAQEIHRLIGEMIAVDCQPFSIVEDAGFVRLMRHVKPRYNIPSRKYFAEKIVPSIYKSVRDKVQAIVNEAENISFTTDIWTSTNNTPFLSLTAHMLDNNFIANVLVLRTVHFPSTHTSANITDVIEHAVEEFKIPKHKIHIFARDNGHNIVRGIKDTGYESISCFLHTLQLVIKDSIFEQQSIKNMVTQCKKIVGHFSHSPLANSKLAELQKTLGVPQHKLINDVPTRWNSTYIMLERMVEQKLPIANYVLTTPNLPTIDANKWNIMGKLVKLLGIFHEITVRLSARSCTAAAIIPEIKYIMHMLEKASSGQRFSGLSSTLTSLKNAASTRFQRYLADYNCILATFLDPRHKDSLFGPERLEDSSRFHRSNLKQKLYDALEKRRAAGEAEQNPEVANSSSESGSDQGNIASLEDFSDLDFDKCYDELATETSLSMETSDSESSLTPRQNRRRGSQSQIPAIFSEFDRYIVFDRVNKDTDSIQWWKANKQLFPLLGSLANKFFSAPPSSIESERLFSIGGNIYTPHRNRLSPETGEELMLLNYNLRYFEFQY